MRKLAALAAVSLVAMVGCKSSDDTKSTDATSATTVPGTGSTTASTGSTGTTEFVSDDTRAPGVTADTIKVGITFIHFTDEVKAQLHTWHGDYEAMYRALADKINADGGINGRQIELVSAPQDTGIDGAGDAACTKLAQDEEVFVAMGYFAGDDVLCYLNTHEVPVVGGAQTDDRRAQAKVAWFTTEVGGDAESDAIKALVSNGDLAGKVAVVGADGDQNAYDSTFKSVLTDGGVDVADTGFVDTSSGDQQVMIAAIVSLIERLKSEGIEQVLLLGQGIEAQFLQELAKTDYRPELRFSVLNGTGSYAGDAASDKSVFEGAKVYAPFDPAYDYLTMTDAPTKSCVDTLKAAGIELGDKATWTFESGVGKTWVAAGVACANMELLQAILEKAGANLDYGTFKHAGETLGEVYLYGDTKPRNYSAGTGADGDQGLWLYVWDSTKNDTSFVLGE